MKIEELNNLKNHNEDIIILDIAKKTLRIESKTGRPIGLVDYTLMPKNAIEILENRKFIKKKGGIFPWTTTQ